MALGGADDDLIGRIVGHHRIEARVGAGGMGDVYRAHDTKLDRPVALKWLPRGMAGDAERLRRFHAEARAASSLNHPHILVVHDFGDEDGRPFIVTEFVEGETLRARLQRGSIPVAQAVEIAAQVAGALAARRARSLVSPDRRQNRLGAGRIEAQAGLSPLGWCRRRSRERFRLVESGSVRTAARKIQ